MGPGGSAGTGRPPKRARWGIGLLPPPSNTGGKFAFGRSGGRRPLFINIREGRGVRGENLYRSYIYA